MNRYITTDTAELTYDENVTCVNEFIANCQHKCFICPQTL